MAQRQIQAVTLGHVGIRPRQKGSDPGLSFQADRGCVISRRCLDCHGEPKGEPDKTGHPREGLRLGQNAGAISVIIPIKP